MVTTVPDGPLLGVNDVIVGGGGSTVKTAALEEVPPLVVTEMNPVVAAAGTVAVISEAEFTMKLEAGTLSKTTLLAPLKLLPLIVTTVPTMPLVGLKALMEGGGVPGPISMISSGSLEDSLEL